MKKLEYILVRILSLFIAILPFFIVYLISDFFRFIIYYIVKYRRDIVRSNLTLCFPNKPLKEIIKIEKQFYRNLSDITIESIKGLYMTKKQLSKRFKVLNPEILQKYYDEKRDVLNVAGHVANWEWGILAVDFQIPHQAASLYKPLSNKYMEKFYIEKRKRFGMEMVAIENTKEYFMKKKDKPVSYIMAADQNPTNHKSAIVVNFFGIETACLHGPEAYGRKTNMPIVYFNIKRVKRGYYTLEIIKLFDEPAKTNFGEITKKYMSQLEKIITETPHDWLWSHKRWKISQSKIDRIKKLNEERILQENSNNK